MFSLFKLDTRLHTAEEVNLAIGCRNQNATRTSFRFPMERLFDSPGDLSRQHTGLYRYSVGDAGRIARARFRNMALIVTTHRSFDRQKAFPASSAIFRSGTTTLSFIALSTLRTISV